MYTILRSNQWNLVPEISVYLVCEPEFSNQTSVFKPRWEEMRGTANITNDVHESFLRWAMVSVSCLMPDLPLKPKATYHSSLSTSRLSRQLRDSPEQLGNDIRAFS